MNIDQDGGWLIWMAAVVVMIHFTGLSGFSSGFRSLACKIFWIRLRTIGGVSECKNREKWIRKDKNELKQNYNDLKLRRTTTCHVRQEREREKEEENGQTESLERDVVPLVDVSRKPGIVSGSSGLRMLHIRNIRINSSLLNLTSTQGYI